MGKSGLWPVVCGPLLHKQKTMSGVRKMVSIGNLLQNPPPGDLVFGILPLFIEIVCGYWVAGPPRKMVIAGTFGILKTVKIGPNSNRLLVGVNGMNMPPLYFKTKFGWPGVLPVTDMNLIVRFGVWKSLKTGLKRPSERLNNQC